MDELEDMEEQVQILEASNKRLSKEKEELDIQLKQISLPSHELSEELAKQRQQIAALQEAREKTDQDFKDLAAKYKDAKQVIMVLEEEVRVLEKEKQEMEQKFLNSSMRFDREIIQDPLSSPGKSRQGSMKYGQRSTGSLLSFFIYLHRGGTTYAINRTKFARNEKEATESKTKAKFLVFLLLKKIEIP